MILYKYFDPDSGDTFWDDLLINFTPPKYFNDPFEVTSTYPAPTKNINVIDRKRSTDEIYRTNYNVLSLTRSPLNKLMWAHYAKDHKGYVVGIDVNQSVFTNTDTCSIPVQFGSVIYTQTKPNSELLNVSAGSAFKYDFPTYKFDNAELLHRLFLYKSIDWAYEEEVRIVKMFGDIGLYRGDDDPINIEMREHFQVTTDNESTWFKLKVPANSIKEIYFGVNNDLSMLEKVQTNLPTTTKYKCATNSFTWDLIPNDL